jgi:hypothetical protein
MDLDTLKDRLIERQIGEQNSTTINYRQKLLNDRQTDKLEHELQRDLETIKHTDRHLHSADKKTTKR